jgi:ATP-dependent RNA helicase SUPV3L1/SUV3
LVTIPAIEGIDSQVYMLAGYRPAGARAIRIDMLERLADQVRSQDSRAGFEANPDMLSITGMTLEQFADLMQGLGYKAERGERAKLRAPAQEPTPTGTSEAEALPGQDVTGEAHPGAAGTSEVEAVPTAETPVEPSVAVDHLEGAGAASVEAQPGADAAATAHPGEAGTSEAQAKATPEDETEVFFTFTWAGFARPKGGARGKPRAEGGGKPRGEAGGKRPADAKPRGKGKPKGAAPKREDKPASFSSRPPRNDRIDPDNPFAQALMGFKGKK